MSIELLSVENQSALHKGHAGDDGSGESHIFVTIKSPDLKLGTRLENHRKVIDIIGKDIVSTTHALSIKIL
ncbi:MAG: BolA/IbaG family iron-sulfur metabolism protein [Rhodospirillales bacterium]|nr:BolA/IbaG family iron-sulfur metabolism protein [Rhodospirillales bacterium]MCB9964976.1 BolA/IbaG family iron-sulfur metabolism protein [Rhodospirillales bacterium]MCB9973432.1 BolA/IbaG family iron-sulfur metabolism protein [Rhodospirillales bacterium]MCB9980435.1 BolA/IbaG family iron-sulfur metabolism protein [Rhodospirillales bacterium]